MQPVQERNQLFQKVGLQEGRKVRFLTDRLKPLSDTFGYTHWTCTWFHFSFVVYLEEYTYISWKKQNKTKNICHFAGTEISLNLTVVNDNNMYYSTSSQIFMQHNNKKHLQVSGSSSTFLPLSPIMSVFFLFFFVFVFVFVFVFCHGIAVHGIPAWLLKMNI